MSSILYAYLGNNASAFKDQITSIKEFLSSGEERVITKLESFNYVYGVIQTRKDKRLLISNHRDYAISIVISGNIYKSDQTKGENDIERVLNAYLTYNYDFAKLLRGIFTVLIHDHKKNEVVIANDHFGLQPCYYTKSGDGYFFATEAESFVISGLLKPALDNNSLSELFAVGAVLGNKTLLKDVFRLTPSSTIIYRNGKVTIKSNAFSFRSGIRGKNISDWCNDIDVLLNNAVKMQLDYASSFNQKIELALSGGLDSRILLAIMLKNQIDFKAITGYDPYGIHEHEVIYSKRLSKLFGFEHETYLKPFGSTTRYNAMLLPPFYNLIKPIEFSGYGAEVLKGDYYKRYKTVEISKRKSILLKIFSKSFTQKLTQNPFYTLIREIDKINHPSFEKRKELFYIGHLGSFFRNERPPQHRPKQIFLNYSHFPFLDYDLIEYITDIPMEHLKWKQLFIKFVKSKYLEYFKAPSTTKDRLNPKVKEIYDSRTTLNEKQYMIYYDRYKSFSPLWEKNIFTNSFEDKDSIILACLFNVWYDRYFKCATSSIKMKAIENQWLISHASQDKICLP